MKTTKATKPKASALTTDQLLQILMAQIQKESHGPEEEKWVMPDEPASLMAETRVERVALVAATLSRTDLPAHECVIKAYEIIHWASVGRGFLAGNPHPRINRWTTLVTDHIRKEQSGEMVGVEESAMSFVKWDEKNKPLPLAYVDALAGIDPKQDRTDRREPRIIDWMVAVGRAKSRQEAEKILKGWKAKNEVPFMDFDHAFYSFRVWMKTKTSLQNAEKPKKTALTDEKIALLEALLTKEQQAELKALKEEHAKEDGQPKENPQPKPKRKKKLKPTDARKESKYLGKVGKGRGYDEVVHKIPKENT
jgi:hypothetical protein